jgi:imidazolonepropionase-like amidohydrolase
MTRIVFSGGKVFDGSGSPAAPGDVVIEDGRIVEVGSGLDGDEVVDASGCTVLPGLFDCHVHVTMSGVDLVRTISSPFSLQFYEAAQNLRTTLACGITSIRDASGADLGVAEAVRRGVIPGPRMQIAISMLSQTGGHGDDWMACGSVVPNFVAHPGRPDAVVDGPDEVRRKVRELIRDGADVIKMATTGGVLSPRSNPKHSHFRDEEVAVAVAEAAAAGISVMAHAQGTAGVLTAVRNGVRSIEHGIYLTDEVIELMLERGTWLVPTLIAPRMAIAAADAGLLSPAMAEKARMVVDKHTDSVRAAAAAGVRIAMGTDSGVGPHGDNLEELTLMAECGMSPAQVLHATTASAAQLLGVSDELGTIEPGKRADLVLVEGDAERLIVENKLRQAIRGVHLDGVLAV